MKNDARTDSDKRIDELLADRQAKVAKAYSLTLQGKSLYEIAMTLGVTKDWLRHYAGLGR